MKKKIFTTEELEMIIQMYCKDKYTMTKIGETFGVSKTVISRVLKEQQIQNNDKHKYQCNYQAFKIIDSSEKAYWLGFLAADGCIYKRKNSNSNFISVNIHSKDNEHLQKFLEFLNANIPIKTIIQQGGYSNNTPMSRITINSKDMVEDCVDKGIVPRKSLVLEPPKIDEKYYLPFILGYFDGDGSIYQTSQGAFGISIEGTKELLEWINSILHIANKLEKRNNDDTNNYYIRCGGINKPYEIMKKLYDSCSIHLDRKYKKFQILQTVVLNRNIQRLSDNELLENPKG